MNNIACWTVRGLNGSIKAHEVNNLISSHRCCIVGLVETMVAEKNSLAISTRIRPNWSWVINYSSCSGGRIWVGWDPNLVSCTIISSEEQVIHLEALLLEDNIPYILSFIYGANSISSHRLLWDSLRAVSNHSGDLPWAALGDFNPIRSPFEALGGIWHNNSLIDFDSCLRDCDLNDVCHEGMHYTWNDGRDASLRIYRKLNRVVANGCWFDKFRRAKALFPPPRLSDHSPCILIPTGDPPRKHGFFRFNNFLTKSPKFLSLVTDAWMDDINGSPMFRLVSRLKNVKKSLKMLNVHEGDVHEEVTRARERLDAIQNHTPSNLGSLLEERSCRDPYHAALAMEADLMKQKAKIRWLKEGDQCNKFFFKTVNGNNNKNRIISLLGQGGNPTIGALNVQNLIVDHFSRALGTGRTYGSADADRLRPYILHTVPESLMDPLVGPLSDEEIHNGIFSIGDYRAPRPDGFSSHFFKESWDIIGSSVCEAIHDFFQSWKASQTNEFDDYQPYPQNPVSSAGF
ncbi:hypothetical protein Nepgr_023192 [Nepenthes gracilis]|uniref:Uncharacterized protein n=1 Tax=Nepenthes gracilis TaxID=150966 RepID=A0AAD3T0T1_NEPGR|nr:hypothetical protein Nepgr_023192 [Nepenthes gracilis]